MIGASVQRWREESELKQVHLRAVPEIGCFDSAKPDAELTNTHTHNILLLSTAGVPARPWCSQASDICGQTMDHESSSSDARD